MDPGPEVLHVTCWLGLPVPATTAVNWSEPPALIWVVAAVTATLVTVGNGITVIVVDIGELVPPLPEQAIVYVDVEEGVTCFEPFTG
jgi:hypothetical protein